ncbi:hypothetical protein BDV98DRAFT_574616 [Pterulicium gracile]|uniref:Uncharacterized protein n=1 Tax=Pterulicium gracile TaxID=1884261 RepID=A0A5C3Q5B8_9AGAR|nr:hypothetical protein BDV98DRAFT_574616 [Pterula gracilis]
MGLRVGLLIRGRGDVFSFLGPDLVTFFGLGASFGGGATFFGAGGGSPFLGLAAAAAAGGGGRLYGLG